MTVMGEREVRATTAAPSQPVAASRPVAPSEPEAAIEIRGLSKSYGHFHAVRDVSLDIAPGEIFSLLGPNGAGKTTTVEILAGVRLRSAGQVRVLGEDPAKYTRTFRDRVGVVPQSTSAFDDLRVRELIGHFSRIYSRPLPVGEAIDRVGLTDKTNAYCRTLSGGQRRRVDVALALIGDPDLIFLDEPTTGLDPEVRRHAWDLVRMLAARGKTTLLTTHYLDEAETLSDRVGIMVRGALVEVGSPDTIGGRRQSDVTVSFRRGALAGRALPGLPIGSHVLERGDRVEVRTTTPTAVTRVLIDWAADDVARAGSGWTGELPDLRIDRDTLEDIYLRMIAEHDRQAEQPWADQTEADRHGAAPAPVDAQPDAVITKGVTS
jgi:ABC-2 type transport system ATP-binding protein